MYRDVKSHGDTMSWPFGRKPKEEPETTTEDTLRSLQLIALEMESTKRKLTELIESLKKEKEAK